VSVVRVLRVVRVVRVVRVEWGVRCRGGCSGAWRVCWVLRRQLGTHHVGPLGAVTHALEHREDECPVE
jgi:hypothetical protein